MIRPNARMGGLTPHRNYVALSAGPTLPVCPQFASSPFHDAARAAISDEWPVPVELSDQTALRYKLQVILNPLDARSSYWSPGEELQHEAEAWIIAESVFPGQQH